MQNTEIEDIIKKISLEVDTVRNHISDAKYNLSIGKFDIAEGHLKKAKEVSTCSYCQQKITKFLADIDYSNKLCSINYKTCEDTKSNTLLEMEEFFNKLPNIEEIRKNKATNQNIDIVAEVSKSIDSMGKAFSEMIGSLFK